MQKKLLVSLIVAAISLTSLFSTLGVILPPSKKITLSWDYPEQNADIVFNVYATTDLSQPMSKWTLITNTATTSVSVPAPYDCQFFTVTASNVVTQTESNFAGS